MKRDEIIAKIEELKKQKEKAELDASIQDTFQHAYKIFLNSVYGFSGTQFSPVFNKDYAESVTLTGQKVIKEMVRYTNACLNKLGKSDEDDEFVIAGDTDSVLGDSIITLNRKQIPISKAFETIANRGTIDTLKNGTEVAVPTMDTFGTMSLNGMTLVKNISRHKVKKKLYSIEIPGHKPLIVTEDHSIMIKRNGKIIECKPARIRDTDELILE
jgi:DNA polymerase elongation subunit (family B)